MANCNQQFLDFDGTINLNNSRRDSLKTSRRSLRQRIRDDFKVNHKDEIQPKFWSQGSFQMRTAINPIGREGEVAGKKKILYKYDVDDGIYFMGSIEKRKSIEVYHNWICDAVRGQTSTDPIDKDPCVRTIYDDGHHIDQPIYFEVEGSVPELAHKTKRWIASDPREFTDWFEEKVNGRDQLRKMVRYLKAWCDYQNFLAPTKKMPSGFVMTIWASENFVANERDDVAMKNLLVQIKSIIDNQSKLTCDRPTTPAGENLLEDYAYEEFFRTKLQNFVESAKQAIAETNPKRACGKWQRHFGDRFSCATAKDIEENAKSYVAPAIITENAKSAK